MNLETFYKNPPRRLSTLVASMLIVAMLFSMLGCERVTIPSNVEPTSREYHLDIPPEVKDFQAEPYLRYNASPYEGYRELPFVLDLDKFIGRDSHIRAMQSGGDYSAGLANYVIAAFYPKEEFASGIVIVTDACYGALNPAFYFAEDGEHFTLLSSAEFIDGDGAIIFKNRLYYMNKANAEFLMNSLERIIASAEEHLHH